MEITDKLVGIWFAELDNDSDFLMQVNEEEDHYHLEYRFRYYHSDDPFDPKDVKNWYAGKVEKAHVKGLKEVITKVRGATEMLVGMAGESAKVHEMLKGDKTTDEFVEEFMAQPFTHQREATEEEKARFDTQTA
jgi:hypothetical protein